MSTVSISFKSWLLYFLRACTSGKDHPESLSSVNLQQFLEWFYNFAFLGTNGAGTLPPPCSKLLAQYVYCRAVTDTLPPRFTEKRNVEKSSITVPVSGVFLINNLIVDDIVDDIVSHFLTFPLKFGSSFNKPPVLIFKNGWLKNAFNK